MNVVGIDCSSPRGSVALCTSDGIVTEREWSADSRDDAVMWTLLRELLVDHAMDWGAVHVWVAGCGPGSYTGLRIAITAARVLALAGNSVAVGLDSGWATAQRAMELVPAEQILVAGDARRGQAWYGLFRRNDAGLAVQIVPWSLCPLAKVAELVPPGGVGCSPDWERLSKAPSFRPDVSCWWPHSVPPSARWLAERAAELAQSGEPLNPPSPVYLHPPVETPTISR